MRTHRLEVHLAVAALVAVVSVAAVPSARADDGPVALHPRVTLTDAQRERLQAVADKGVGALRRYVERTRAIYGWSLHDLA